MSELQETNEELQEAKEEPKEESDTDESEGDEEPSEEEQFPVLRLIRPDEVQLQAEKSATVLFRPPKPPRSRKLANQVQQKAKSGINKLRKKSLDDMFGELSSRRKKRSEKGLSLFNMDGSGSLTRSFSLDNLHRANLLKETIPEEKDTTDSGAKTFVYVPPSLAARQKKKSRSVTPPPSEAAVLGEDTGASAEPAPSQPLDSPPGKNLSADNSESASVNTGAKRKRSRQSDQSLQGPVAPTITSSTTVKAFAASSELTATQTTQLQQQAEATKDVSSDESVGMLRVKLLAVSVPQKLRARKYGDPDENSGQSGDEKNLVVSPEKEEPPTDGIFCMLNINGRHFQAESPVRPLDTRKQLALWDSSEPESVFYVSPSQQLFVTSRKIPLADVRDKQNVGLSRHPRAESVGVGILPVSQLSRKSIVTKDKWLENWTEIEAEHSETTVILEPRGSVLLGISYITFSPRATVSCTGSVIVQSVSGVDCSWNGELCLIGCTLDIDSTNYGSTGNVLGLEDMITDGWSEDYIEFECNSNYLCRVDIWGFATDETEHCFGEVCVPLAAILPYSKQIVHQENDEGPLQLLERYERQLTVPIEPKGVMKLQFSLSPLHSEARGYECDGPIISTPQRNESVKETSYHPDFEHSMEVSIPTLPVTNGLHPPTSFTASSACSGSYDHLMPPPNTRRSLSIKQVLNRSRAPSSSNRDGRLLTWRFLGTTKIQVPKDYHEKKFKMLTDTYDPSKEVELLKEQLRDVNGKLAESEFYREKAELQVKSLKEEVQKWKKKCKKKQRK